MKQVAAANRNSRKNSSPVGPNANAVLLILCCFLLVPFRVSAQDSASTPVVSDDFNWTALEGSEPWPSELTEVNNLPEAPTELARLLRAGQVAFKFYDAQNLRRTFTGETRMAMKYTIDVRFRWRLVRAAGKRKLAVTVQHQPTRFEMFHQILLPLDHANAQMYAAPLVLHELDHVRIAVDPRYPAQFEEWFQAATKSLTIELDSRTKESEFAALIQAEIQAKSVPCFEKMLQLIQIRNRELDRQTQHGRVPLAEDFFGRDEEH